MATPPPAKVICFDNLTSKFSLFLVTQGLWIFLFLALLPSLTDTQLAQIKKCLDGKIEELVKAEDYGPIQIKEVCTLLLPASVPEEFALQKVLPYIANISNKKNFNDC